MSVISLFLQVTIVTFSLFFFFDIRRKLMWDLHILENIWYLNSELITEYCNF